MRNILKNSLAAAALTAAFCLPGITPASAQVAGPGSAVGMKAVGDLTTSVQYRSRHYGGRHHYRGPRHHHHHRRGYYGPGPGIGLGLAAGAIIGGAMAAQAAQPRGDVHAYCASKYRSYDPRTMTFLGYDGLRHPCP